MVFIKNNSLRLVICSGAPILQFFFYFIRNHQNDNELQEINDEKEEEEIEE